MNFNASAAANTMTTRKIVGRPAVLGESFDAIVGKCRNFGIGGLLIDADAVLEWKKLADNALAPMTPSQLLKGFTEYNGVRTSNGGDRNTFIRNEIAAVSENNPQIAKHIKYWNVRSETPCDIRIAELSGVSGRIAKNLKEALEATVAEGDFPPPPTSSGSPQPN